MLVRSNAPQATQKQVTAFLDSQKIQWKETSAPADATLVQNGFNYSNDARQVRQKQAERISQTSNLAQQQLQQQTQNAVAPTTAMAKNAAEALQDNTTQPAPAGNANYDRLAQAQRMYVARMSRSQAVHLSNAIAQEPAQSTQYKDLSGATVTLAELGAGKAPAPFGMANNAATEPADASQTLAQSDRAAGRRLDPQAPVRMRGGGGGGFGGGGGLGAGGFGGRPGQAGGDVAAGLAATAPTTQSSAQGQSADQGQLPPAFQVILPATQSTAQLQSATTQTASTQPSATQPGEDTLDIVIVVESDPIAPAVAPPAAPAPVAPTSQPAPAQSPASTQPAAGQ
jgi:hypothetical protein